MVGWDSILLNVMEFENQKLNLFFGTLSWGGVFLSSKVSDKGKIFRNSSSDHMFFPPIGGNFEENFFPQNFKVNFSHVFSEGSSRFFAGVQFQSVSPNFFFLFFSQGHACVVDRTLWVLTLWVLIIPIYEYIQIYTVYTKMKGSDFTIAIRYLMN